MINDQFITDGHSLAVTLGAVALALPSPINIFVSVDYLPCFAV
jgi:hypothetical protein